MGPPPPPPPPLSCLSFTAVIEHVASHFSASGYTGRRTAQALQHDWLLPQTVRARNLCATCDCYICPHACPQACPHVRQNLSHVSACLHDLYPCHLCPGVCPLQHVEAQLSCPCEHGLERRRQWVYPCWLSLWSQKCLACIGQQH